MTDMTIISRAEAKERGLKRYFTGVACPAGHSSQRFTSNYCCVACVKKKIGPAIKRWKDRNATEVAAKARNARLDQRVRFILNSVRSRTKKSGIDFNLTPADIIIPSACPVLGIPLSLDNSRLMDDSPSLDRKDNTKGYVKGNVEIISWRANRIKNDSTLRELILLVLHASGGLTWTPI